MLRSNQTENSGQVGKVGELTPLVYLAFRLVDLVSHDAPVVRERAVLTLKVMAGVAMGKEVIVNNEGLLTNLLGTVEDSYFEVRVQVAACLEMVARYWKSMC